jgi:hypothetical protein
MAQAEALNPLDVNHIVPSSKQSIDAPGRLVVDLSADARAEPTDNNAFLQQAGEAAEPIVAHNRHDVTAETMTAEPSSFAAAGDGKQSSKQAGGLLSRFKRNKSSASLATEAEQPTDAAVKAHDAIAATEHAHGEESLAAGGAKEKKKGGKFLGRLMRPKSKDTLVSNPSGSLETAHR